MLHGRGNHENEETIHGTTCTRRHKSKQHFEIEKGEKEDLLGWALRPFILPLAARINLVYATNKQSDIFTNLAPRACLPELLDLTGGLGWHLLYLLITPLVGRIHWVWPTAVTNNLVYFSPFHRLTNLNFNIGRKEFLTNYSTCLRQRIW